MCELKSFQKKKKYSNDVDTTLLIANNIDLYETRKLWEKWYMFDKYHLVFINLFAPLTFYNRR